MLSLRRCSGWVLVVGLGAACGGSSFTSAQMGTEEGGVEASAGGGDGSVSDGTVGGDAAGSDAQGPRDAQADVQDGSSAAQDSGDAMAADGPVAPCADVRGTYLVTVVGSGPANTGCGDLNTSASECIRQPLGTCAIELRSNPTTGGGPVAVAGSAQLQNDNVFDSAALTEGTANRTGCTGVWNPATSALTVDCGGTGTTQSCIVKLTRTGPVGVVCN
jgi:hypothetical protein